MSFLKGLAIAELEGGRHAGAVATLQRLFSASPEQKTGDLAAQALKGMATLGR